MLKSPFSEKYIMIVLKKTTKKTILWTYIEAERISEDIHLILASFIWLLRGVMNSLSHQYDINWVYCAELMRTQRQTFHIFLKFIRQGKRQSRTKLYSLPTYFIKNKLVRHLKNTQRRTLLSESRVYFLLLSKKKKKYVSITF